MSTADLHPVNERTSLIRPVLEKPLPGPRDISPGRRYGILAGIWAGTFLSSLNLTLVSTLLPLISADFHNSNQASWLGTAYLLAACTFTPLYGRLCNVMGRRAATQTAVIFSVLGTTLCGLAPSMEMLIAARFLGGLGGGGIITTTKVITSDLYSLRSRGFTQGIAALFVGLGMGLGVPLGGLIGDLLGWRWAFLLQTPLFAFPLFMTSVNIQYSTPSMGKGAFDVLKRIDYGGALTLMATVFSFLSFLGARFNTGLPMHDPTVLASLVCAIVFFFAFVGWELYVATEPMLAPSLLQEKVPVLVGMSNFLVDFSNYGIAYFFPMWFQTVMQTSASEAGMHLLPNSIAMAFGSLFSGWIMHRTGRFKMLDVFIGFFPFVASILIMRLRPDSSPTALWLSIIPLGFGNSVVLQTMLIALLAHIPADAVAVGTGFALLFRGLGQVAGVGVASAIFQYHLDAALKLRITGPNADAMVSQIRHSIAFVSSLPVAMQAEARISYAFALRAVFIAISVASLVGYVVRLLVPEKDLDERPRSEHEFGPAPIMVGISTARLMTIVEESSPKSTFYDEAEEPLRALPSRPGEAYRKVVVSMPSNIV